MEYVYSSQSKPRSAFAIASTNSGPVSSSTIGKPSKVPSTGAPLSSK